jgi:hypothetical protein
MHLLSKWACESFDSLLFYLWITETFLWITQLFPVVSLTEIHLYWLVASDQA